MQVVNRFMALPTWVRVAAVVAALVVVLGAVSIPVAAVAVDGLNRQLALEVEAKEAAAEKKAAAEAAEALAEAKESATRYNAEFAGLTVSLAAAVHPDAAAAFEAARVKLAFAIADGDLEEVSAAVAAVTEALDGLVASAEGRADALIGASPLAGASRDALTQAIADLATDDDVTAAFARVKVASDAVVAAQQAGLAAAEAAAKQLAEAEEGNASNGDSSSGGDPSDGSVSIGHFPDPGIIGMTPGERGSCGEYPTGQVVTRDFGWQAREGNTVDIYYALTDGDYQATGDFWLLASGLGSSGSVSIPVTCPNAAGPASYSYITVKAVAINENGSAAAYYWGL